MSYVIEDGIPIPDCMSGGKGGAPRNPITAWTKTLDMLNPGQSVLTENHKDYRAADQFKVRRPEKKFAIRKIPGEGWRVWRLA